MRPAASSRWQNVRMLSAGELPPFARIASLSTPLPAALPMVSVVIAARDNEGTITQCLESIGRLRYPNYEVILVDDGSRDRTVDIAATIKITKPVEIIGERRAGLGAAWNAAMRAARGDFVAFTRADCVVNSDWLAMATRVMLEGRLDACAGPIYLSVKAHGIATRAIAALSSLMEATQSSIDAARNHEMLLSGRNMILRKSSLIEAGGFDSRFADSASSAELAARMVEVGMAIGWCPAGFVKCREAISVGAYYHRRIAHGRAEAMLERKHPGRFGSEAARTHRLTALATGAAAINEGIWAVRREETADGIVVGALCAILSLSGMIVETLARRYYAIESTGAVAMRSSNAKITIQITRRRS
jgi:GT2 family glycosyltransferase